MQKDLSSLTSVIKYSFSDKTLLNHAMTHKSYSSERSLNYDNQRLEFLGDAVMQIIITDYLFVKYPDLQEGELTKMRSALACQDSFSQLAMLLKLNDYIRMGRGELKVDGNLRKSTLCDAFEALVGAIYLDGSIEVVSTIITPILITAYPDPINLLSSLNPKGELQELTQLVNKLKTPEYNVIEKVGPDHDCIYKVSVSIDNEIISYGVGKSRKLSEMDAAIKALESLRSSSGRK